MTDRDPGIAPVVAYERAALDQYLAASAEARVRLTRDLVEAQTRLARARAAVDAHRLLADLATAAVDDVTRSRRRLGTVAALLAAPLAASTEPVR
jgi:hypothetical protein